MNNAEKIIFIIMVLLLGVASRLIPHIPNVTPITATSIFIFAYISKKYFWIPILILFLSDIFMGIYDIRLMLVVYLSFIIIGSFGHFLKSKKSILKIFLVSLSGSIFFFLTTNFAVWIFSSWYDKNLYGLLDCYMLAIPFFRNMALGDLFYLYLFILSSEFVFNYKYSIFKKFFNLTNKNV